MTVITRLSDYTKRLLSVVRSKAARARLGHLTGRMELRLDDGSLPDGHSLWGWDGVPSGVLRWQRGSLEGACEVAWPLLRHLIVARVEELLLQQVS